jgi:hypothetical protein
MRVGTCVKDGLVDEEERIGGDIGGGLDLGNDGAYVVLKGGGPIELRAEGHEMSMPMMDGGNESRAATALGGAGSRGVAWGGGGRHDGEGGSGRV